MGEDNEFDFQEAEAEFSEPASALDAARERGGWESPEERERALNEAVNDYIKEHRGKRINIKYVGGFYDGRYSVVRAPLKKMMEVAKPPKETSPGVFEASPSSIEYEAYYLRVVDDVAYYVEESALVDFAKEHYG